MNSRYIFWNLNWNPVTTNTRIQLVGGCFCTLRVQHTKILDGHGKIETWSSHNPVLDIERPFVIPSLQWINSSLYSMRGDPLFTFPFVKTPYPIIQNRNMNWSINLKTTFLITAFPHSVKSRVKIVARYMTLPDSKILFFEKNLKTTKNVWPFNQRDSKNT